MLLLLLLLLNSHSYLNCSRLQHDLPLLNAAINCLVCRVLYKYGSRRPSEHAHRTWMEA